MTLVALVHPCVRFTGHGGRNHLKMHHIVTWRSLMALAAIMGPRRGMSIFSHSPAIGSVTLCAVRAEQALMLIVITVTGETIENRLRSAYSWMKANPYAKSIND